MGRGCFDYQFHALGQWRLEADSRVLNIRGHKTRALLGYLAFSNDRAHTRNALAAVFWPQLPLTRARGSLRQALSDIRRAIGDHDKVLLATDRDHVKIVRDAFKTDFDLALDAVKRGDLNTAEVEAIPHVLNIFNEFHSISEALDEWIYGLRADLAERATRSLFEIYDAPNGEEAKKLRAAQVAFQLDNFDESAARAIIRSNAAMNKISTAIRFYDELYERFETELDTSPSLATQDLAAQVKMTLNSINQAPVAEPEASIVAAVPAIPSADDLSIAVVPFEELGPVPTPGYVTLGLLDEITCALAGLTMPSPISSNTMRRYLGGAAPRPAQVHQDIGARYVVTGSIRSDGQNATVTVQMADALSEKVLWADIYRCQHTGVLDVQPAIVGRIVSSVVPSVHGAELLRTRGVAAEDLEPLHLVLRARERIFALSFDSFTEAGELLEAAVGRGVHFAPAHAMLADWHSIRIWQGWTDNADADQKKLEFHALRAIELMPSDGRMMAFLGHNRLIFSRSYDEATSYFDRALSILPSDSETLSWTVPGLTYAGRANEAIENGERAIALSPFDPFHFRNQHFLSIAHYAVGNFDRASELGLQSYEGNPTYISNLRFTIASLQAAGERSKATELVSHHHDLEPEFRVNEFISRHPFRNDAKRHQYGRDLVEAGLHA